MARYHSPGNWICGWCDRVLPETEFPPDGWRRQRGKGPGTRCRDCDREYTRAKTAISPTGKLRDADHSAAYHLAKPVCQAHAWGTGYYSQTDKTNARQQAANARTGRPEKMTATERRRAGDDLMRRAERDRARRDADLEHAANARASTPRPATTGAGDDAETIARKNAIRERRRRR